VTEAEIERLRALLPELPDAKRERYVRDWGLRRSDAALLASERAVSDYFEAAVAAYGTDAGRPQRLAYWLTGELFRLIYADGEGTDLRPIAETRVRPPDLAALLRLVDDKTVNPNTAKRVLETMYATGEEPAAIVAREGLGMVSDTGVIDAAIDEIFAAGAAELARYRAGEAKLFGFFMGQVMKATKGKADPALAKQRLQERIQG
jgi:aspartyl-tRNA(Asn)/glutamyl-tRNA(Gln) amidotransferase subunit B